MKSSVLLVDQDSAETASLIAALRAEGFDVDVASSEAQALDRLARGEHAIALVELMLRGETGLRLARRIREAAPATKVFLTGLYVLSERQLERAAPGVSGFVPKPWDISEVATFLAAKAAASSRPRLASAAEAGAPGAERHVEGSGAAPLPAADEGDDDETLTLRTESSGSGVCSALGVRHRASA